MTTNVTQKQGNFQNKLSVFSVCDRLKVTRSGVGDAVKHIKVVEVPDIGQSCSHHNPRPGVGFGQVAYTCAYIENARYRLNSGLSLSYMGLIDVSKQQKWDEKSGCRHG